MNFDLALFNLIHNLSGKSRLLDFFGVFFADYFGYFLIIAVGLILFSRNGWKEKYRYFSLISLAVILSRGIFTELIRFFWHRPRPFLVLNFTPLIEQANQGAFPSGHAAFYFALILPVFLINKKWGNYLAAGVLLMGLSRIFVGVHWPLDIAGGALAAILSVLVAKRILRS
ncbi:MAG: phosphatase PAP2 family protein [Candidatus Harrisonbacteria bacterium]|nr:phosphatase PAP2 family protein [Candidatus Harrisonbacteria bacterium]